MTTHTFTSPSGRCRFDGIVHELDGETWVRNRASLGRGAPGLTEEPGRLLSKFTRGGWIVQPPIPQPAARRTAARKRTTTRSGLTCKATARTPADPAGAA